ncbi:MAG: hypothetical protein ABI661_09390 [Gammaproteobacteria bacterium]
MSTPIALTVNGRSVDIPVDDDNMPLLYALRNAVLDATGIRLRSAPFMPEKVLAGLRAI